MLCLLDEPRKFVQKVNMSVVRDQIVRLENQRTDPMRVFLNTSEGHIDCSLLLFVERVHVMNDSFKEVCCRRVEVIGNEPHVHHDLVKSPHFFVQIHFFDSHDSVDVVLEFVEPLPGDAAYQSADVKLLTTKTTGLECWPWKKQDSQQISWQVSQ